jgi:CRISPR-associated protein Csm4
MDTYKVCLKPKGAITNYPPSDTLFGAIMWGIREVLGDTKLNNYKERFLADKPPFILSSSFPMIKNETELSFLPKPIQAPLRAEEIEDIVRVKVKTYSKRHLIGTIESYKRFRKAKFVSFGVADKLLNGLSEFDLFSKHLTKNIILHSIGETETIDYGDEVKLFGGLLLLRDEFDAVSNKLDKKLTERGIIVRNTIDRFSGSTGEGQLFYTEEIFVAKPQFLLYFLIRTEEKEIETILPALKYLEDTGIGRDRAVGRNQFEISEPTKVDLNLNAEGDRFVCLSRYIPKEDEVVLPPQTPFELISIHSKVESRREFKGKDIWKKHFFYFTEGSTLEAKERKEFYGLTPVAKKLKGQTIIQNGLCLPIFGKIGG